MKDESFSCDRTSRDERLSEVSHKLESTKSALSLKVNKLKTELVEHEAHTALLNDQVSDFSSITTLCLKKTSHL